VHDAYVFWSAAARDAAYQLLLPTERARLHALALDSLDPATSPEELAEHARLAQESGGAEHLLPRELAFTRIAAREALKAGRHFDAARLCARWAQLCDQCSAELGEAMLARANALANAGRASEAEACAREAVRAAQSDAFSAEAWRAVCEVLYQSGRYEAALEAGAQAIACAELARDARLLAQCTHAQLSPLRELGRRQQYEALTRRLGEIATADPRLLPLALSGKGHACLAQSDIAGAVEHFSRTESECADLMSHRQRLNNLICLGQCYCRAADSRASATLNRALALATSVGDRFLLGMAEAALGGLAYESGQSEAAEKHHAASQAFAEELGDEMMLAIALGNRGSALFNGGHFDAALACYARATEVNVRLQRPLGSALNRMNRGVVLRTAGRSLEALDCLRDASEELRKLGARGPRVFALCESVMLLIELGQFAQARALQSEADQYAAGLSETRVLAMLHESRAALLEHARDFKSASQELQSALAYYEQEGMARPLDALRLRLSLLRLLLETGRREEARECCRLARVYATQAKATPAHPLPHVRKSVETLDELERELSA
jgi:tetratricopeptide (TPR) repeat protein